MRGGRAPRRSLGGALLALAALAAVACATPLGPSATPPAGAAAVVEAPASPPPAPPEPSPTPGESAPLAAGEGHLGTCRFVLEVADTPSERGLGLMDREGLPPERAMLFVFPAVDYHLFWMARTLIPLDIVFVDGALRVVDVQTMAPEPGVPREKLTIYRPAAPALYALEMPAGRAAECGVSRGGLLALGWQPGPGE